MPKINHKSWLIDRLVAHGAKPFLATRGNVYTYEQLLTEVSKVDSVLSGNIRSGESVAVVGDYNLASIASLLWLYGNQNIAVPVATSVVQELQERVREGHCSWIVDCSLEGSVPALSRTRQEITTHPLLDKLRDVHHAGLILFSSGSAGKPKAMIHDLNNLVDVYASRKSRNLSMIVFLMFDHIGGVNTLFNSLASGSFVIAPAKRDAEEVAALVERYKVKILPTSPTFLNLLLISEAYRQHDLTSLKIITYGTEPMPESLLTKLREAFPKVRFLQTFGTSETGISRTESKSSTSLYMKLDDPDIEHKVVDGELWLRSKTQILGYLNHSMESFTEDGWFRTGDRVDQDAEGYIRIIGREREIVNVGGEKVIPSEVESVVLEVPGVVDCTVYGQASPITGQIVAAKVVKKADIEASTLKFEIRRHCAEKLLRYKIPVKIEFVESELFSDRFKKRRI